MKQTSTLTRSRYFIRVCNLLPYKNSKECKCANRLAAQTKASSFGTWTRGGGALSQTKTQINTTQERL